MWFFRSKIRSFALVVLSAIGGVICGASLVTAATTIGTNIQTDGSLTVSGTTTTSYLHMPYGGDVETPDVYIGSDPSLFTSELADCCTSGDQINLAFYGSSNNRFSNLQGLIETTDYGEVSIQGMSFTKGTGSTVGLLGTAGNSGPNTLDETDAFRGWSRTDSTGGATWSKVFRASDAVYVGSGRFVNYAGFYADDISGGTSANYGYYSALTVGSGKYAFYGAGTASSYFGGNVGIGSTTPAYGLSIDIVTGTAATSTISDGSSTHPSCLQLYAPNGTGYAVYLNNAGTLTTKSGS